MARKAAEPDPVWISVAKAADYTDLAASTIRTHVAAGDIRAVFAGRVLRVDRNSIDDWLRPVVGVNL